MRQTKKQTLNYRELMIIRGEVGGRGGWIKQLIGMKEGTCDEHWVLYGSVESLYWTPETNLTVLTGISIKT